MGAPSVPAGRDAGQPVANFPRNDRRTPRACAANTECGNRAMGRPAKSQGFLASVALWQHSLMQVRLYGLLRFCTGRLVSNGSPLYATTASVAFRLVQGAVAVCGVESGISLRVACSGRQSREDASAAAG